MNEKKTLKEIECISCQDKDTLCGGYGSKRCLKEFKADLVSELQKELHWTERCFTNESEQWIKGYKKAIKTFLGLLEQK